jgi:hypothetical protein
LKRSLAALAALVLVQTRLGEAQSSSEPWVFRYFVFPGYNTLENLSISATISFRKPAQPGPIPSTAAFELTGRASRSGTRSVQLLFDAPGLWNGWRLLSLAGAERAQRAPYYGLGNDTELDDSLEAANGDVFYYRYSLLRTTGIVAVQRNLTSRVRLLLGSQWRHYRAWPHLDGQTALGDDLAAGRVSDTGRADGVEIRAGLLYDTRDEEASPSRGVLLEAIAARALEGPGDFDYRRYLLAAREFLPLGEFTTLAFRQSVELSSGPIPFFIQYERLTHWRPEDGFGGVTTLRANLPGRWLGPNKAIGSVDLRYRKFDAPFPRSPVRVWLLAFADIGRVWGDGEALDFDGLHGGAGVGFRFQFSKGGLFGVDIGYGPDAAFEIATAFGFAY